MLAKVAGQRTRPRLARLALGEEETGVTAAQAGRQ